MNLSDRDDNYSESDHPPEKQKRYRLELGATQAVVYGVGLVLAMVWMFVFGVLAGRGLPFVDSKDFSFKGEFFRFIGLGEAVQPPVQNAAETWDNPRKLQEEQNRMLESLNYYEDLTHKNAPALPAAPPNPDAPPPPVSPAKESPAAQGAKAKGKAAHNVQPRPESPPVGSPEKSSAQTPSKGESSRENQAERFTLLVSSLRDADSAQKLVEKLRGKGYNARIEPLDLKGDARWNRVLLGSYDSREDALRFAAEFNRKEKMEGLVIRE